ncbi:IclR family transcriptional regulator [Paraburkholderia pallida]|uniref:IclR family transcriptional regulator n=1 Tax=Paraburkholderia pallida TaxID=2547399 RepID=A0A4P7D8P7_9BURK|nr:IclR family transcriptional regulator [Paraburkholderia pallida]
MTVQKKTEDVEQAEQTDDQRPGIQSVEIGAEILSALATFGRPVPLRSLAAKCGMPVGKVHRYLVSLTRSGLVEQDAMSGHYGVGRSAIAIGLSGLWACSPVKEAARAIAQLRDATRETTFGAIWTDMGPTVCLLEESDRPIYMNVRVGALLPVYQSAAGRVFAAHLPEELIRRVVKLQEHALSTPVEKLTSVQARELHQETRANGYAGVAGSSVPGVNAVAAPVHDYKGNVTVVIGLLGREHDLPLSGESAQIRSLLDCAALASERLGYRAGATGQQERDD